MCKSSLTVNSSVGGPQQVSKYVLCFQKHTIMLFMSFKLHYQLQLTKPFKFGSIVSFVNLYNKYLDLKYQGSKRKYTDYFKTANNLFLSHIL